MPTKKDNKYVIVRSEKAGCFAGELVSKDGDSVVLQSARRLWYWAGAASLSQLAMEGTSRPKECKFPPAVTREEILGVCEILDVTKGARISIEGTPVWRA
jgi:hypothetical protein